MNPFLYGIGAWSGKVETGFPKRSCSNKKIALESESTKLNHTLAPGRPEAAAAAVGCGKRGCGNEFGADDGRDHHLCDTLAASDHERHRAVVDQEHADLAAVVGVNPARRVQYGNAMLGGEARPRPDLRLIAWRQRDGQPGRHHVVLSRG